MRNIIFLISYLSLRVVSVSGLSLSYTSIGNPNNPNSNLNNVTFPNGSAQDYGTGGVSYNYSITTHKVGSNVIADYILNSSGRTSRTSGGNRMTFISAARMINHMNILNGYGPAYKIKDLDEPNDTFHSLLQIWQPDDTGYNPNNVLRNSDAYYFLPSVDEFIKAAFYRSSDSMYTWCPGTGSQNDLYDDPSVLSTLPSSYGILSAAYGAHEWLEPDSLSQFLNNDRPSSRVARGYITRGSPPNTLYSARIENIIGGTYMGDGGFYQDMRVVATEADADGLTLSAVPEPSSYALICGGLAIGLLPSEGDRSSTLII